MKSKQLSPANWPRDPKVPETMPQRIADLLRELHKRLRDPGELARRAPRHE